MTAPKNALEQKLNRNASEAGQPPNEQDRIGYAIINEINQDTLQVKVTMLNSDGTPGEELEGGFLPLINPLDDIHMRFGALRVGLICRIYWKGKLRPKNPLVEVIANEEHNFLTKQASINQVEIGPYLIFSGGI